MISDFKKDSKSAPRPFTATTIVRIASFGTAGGVPNPKSGRVVTIVEWLLATSLLVLPDKAAAPCSPSALIVGLGPSNCARLETGVTTARRYGSPPGPFAHVSRHRRPDFFWAGICSAVTSSAHSGAVSGLS